MRKREERATTFQTQAVVAAIGCNVDWAEVSQEEAKRFMNDSMKGDLSTAFVKSGRQVFFGELARLPINRSRSYDLATYPSDVWRISEEDERSLALTEIDPNEIRTVSFFRGEDSVDGEEHFARLKYANHIRLDAQVHEMFWVNRHLIPEAWKEKIDGHHPFIFFDGTILSVGTAGSGGAIALCLCWNGKNWKRDFRYFHHGRTPWMLSAVLGQ